MPQKQKKSLEEIKPILLDFPDGQKKRAYSIGDAAIYLQISYNAFIRFLNASTDIVRYERGVGKEKYVLEEDLKRINMARPATGVEPESEEEQEE